MREDGALIDLSPELIPLQTDAEAMPSPENFGGPLGTFVGSLNGQTGNVVFSGGTSGFTLPSGGGTITLTSPLTTKGDLYVRNASAGTRQPVGSDGQLLHADSAQATGLVWGLVALTSQVTGVLPIANGGTNDTGTAWSSYSPTATPGTGAFTTLGTVTGRSKTLGKTTWVEITIPITTNGTAATSISVTLPSTASAFRFALSGYTTSNHKSLTCEVGVSGSSAVLYWYDGTYPGSDGEVLVVSGVYESV